MLDRASGYLSWTLYVIVYEMLMEVLSAGDGLRERGDGSSGRKIMSVRIWDSLEHNAGYAQV